jgi:hypothetical protein
METAPTTTVVARIACVECGRAWVSDSERWRIKVLFDEQPPEAVPYCPDCHAREFEGN